MKYCSNCGAEIKEGSAFCQKCGTKIGASKDTKKTTESTVVNGNPSIQPKSKLAAGLLGIFLGALGVHNFYLGYNGKAVAQLLITILSCGILGLVSGVWGLIEGILILTGSISVDANGVPLGE